MGKIKGWNRARSNDTIWTSEKSSITIGKRVIIVNNKIQFSNEYLMHIINLSKPREESISKIFKSKKEALAYAIKYMRSHQRG